MAAIDLREEAKEIYANACHEVDGMIASGKREYSEAERHSHIKSNFETAITRRIQEEQKSLGMPPLKSVRFMLPEPEGTGFGNLDGDNDQAFISDYTCWLWHSIDG